MPFKKVPEPMTKSVIVTDFSEEGNKSPRGMENLKIKETKSHARFGLGRQSTGGIAKYEKPKTMFRQMFPVKTTLPQTNVANYQSAVPVNSSHFVGKV
jgi:hypothetical protein